ncbi:MAG: metal ABC transporter solute-binding protein, Zn/Mn family [Planctomycetaceae bacterium]
MSHKSARRLLLLTLLTLGCKPQDAPEASVSNTTPQLRIAVTFSIAEDWVRNVAGAQASIVTLVGRNADAHAWEPSPRSAAALADAEIIFEIGRGFEVWLDDLYTSSESAGKRIALAENLKDLQREPPEGSEPDPHVWHDPVLVVQMIQLIQDALIQHNPRDAAGYRSRGEAYIRRVRGLHETALSLVARVPPERRKLVTAHDTFGFFAGRYGFQIRSLLGAAAGEENDASAGRLADVVTFIRREQVPAVFAENILDPRLSEQAAKAAGVRVVATLYTDALGPPGSDGETWEDLFLWNVRTITESLR